MENKNEELRETLNSFKDLVSVMLSRSLEDVYYMMPEEDEFMFEEDYLLMRKIISLDAINMIKKVKYDIFSRLLDTYNIVITDMNTFKSRYKKENIESEEIQLLVNRSMKRTAVISAGVSFLIPALIPLVLLIGVPSIGMDKMTKDYHKERIEKNNELKELYDIIHKPFYEFISILRRDYHRSNEELKELELRAMNGEDITEELISILDPSRIGLDYIPSSIYEDEDIKQYIKQK